MDKNGYAVIFDTNSYREFVPSFHNNKDEFEKKLRNLLECEAKMNIECYSSSVVQMELLKHFDDKDNGKKISCQSAALFMNRHCQIPNKTITRISPPFDEHICNSFFNDSKYRINYLNLCQCISDFNIDFDLAYNDHLNKGTFKTTYDFVEEMKKKFIDGIIDFISSIMKMAKNEINDSGDKQVTGKMIELIQSDKFIKDFANQLITYIAESLNNTIENRLITEYSYQLIQNFPIVFKFYKYLLIKVVKDKIDLNSKESKKRRWNWYMDYHICAIANHTIQSKKIIIVTKDKDIRNVLSGGEVMDIDNYLKFINYPI